MKNLVWLVLGLVLVALAVPVNAGDITPAPLGTNLGGGNNAEFLYYYPGETVNYEFYVENTDENFPVRIDTTYYVFGAGRPAQVKMEPAPGMPATFLIDPLGQRNSSYSGTVTMDLVHGDGTLRSYFYAAGWMFRSATDSIVARVGQSEQVFIAQPDFEVTKTAVPLVTKADHDVTYEVCVRNTGNVDLNLVSVIDDRGGHLTDLTLAFGGVGAVLPVGSPWVCHTFFYTVQDGDPDPLENTVEFTYNDGVRWEEFRVASASVDLIHPGLTVDKECLSPADLPCGELADFRITITNTGDVDLIVTTDDLAYPGPFTLPSAGPPFEEVVSRLCECPPGEVTNVINVRATLPPEYGLDNEYIRSKEATCYCSCPPPCVEISKVVDCEWSKVGDGVIYYICIENCGENGLTDVEVTDTKLDLTGLFPTELAAGEEVCEYIPYTILPGDDFGPGTIVENQATVTAIDACDGTTPATATSAIVEVTLLHPAFIVEKVCLTPEVECGDPCEFEITIDNKGDVDLIITTDDPAYPGPFRLPSAGPPFVEVVTKDCTCPPNEVCNQITVTATIPPEYCELPNEYVESSDEVCCTCEPPGDATRTPGFWKTHCWYTGEVFKRLTKPVDLGWKKVNTIEEVFGLFWASKTRETDGDKRSPMCHWHMKGTFQLLAAILTSEAVDGASAGSLIPDMVKAMAACDMDKIKDLHGKLDTFNNSGTDIDLGEPWGIADPECAKALADYKYADCDYVCPPASGPVGVAPEAADPVRVDGDRTSEPGILESEIAIPREFSVRAYPNPAGTSAMIRYALPMDSRVMVEILDVQGRSVAKLLDQQMPAGSHSVAWDSQGVPAGVYFCKVQCCDGKETISKVIKVQ